MTRPTPTYAERMSERQLQDAITQLCDLLHLDWFHVLNAKGMRAGWPDLTIIGPTSVLYRELKSTSGQLTTQQKTVGHKLMAAGQDWAIWRPGDWIRGRVERELRHLLPPPTLFGEP